jgi:sugar phosphate isomerase/epimerase
MSDSVIAAQLYTLREHCTNEDDLKTTFEKVRQIGYQAVQVSGVKVEDPNVVAQAAKDNGLTICATHMNWDRFMDDLESVIETHKLWNCTHSAIGGLFGEEWVGRAGVEKFLDQLGPVGEKLAAEGMDFSYHNHSHELVRVDGTTWLGMLYDQADPKHLKAEIDTYWIAQGGGDPAAWVAKCAGREPLLHLKDMAVTRGREQLFAPVGEGNLNWPAILQAARDGGVEWYIVEQDNCYDQDPFDALATSFRNLQAMGLN